MQDHSPFEPGYVGNSDPGGAVAVLDVTFPRERLLGAGASEELVDRLTSDFDLLDHAVRRQAITALEGLNDDELVDALAEAEERYEQQDAYDALSDDDRAAFEALSEEDQAQLVELTDEERAELAERVEPPAAEGADKPWQDLTVDEVLAAVAGDREQAVIAIVAEQKSGAPREDLLEQLNAIVAAPPAEPTQPADTGQ